MLWKEGTNRRTGGWIEIQASSPCSSTGPYPASAERPRYFLDSADPPASQAQIRSLGGRPSCCSSVSLWCFPSRRSGVEQICWGKREGQRGGSGWGRGTQQARVRKLAPARPLLEAGGPAAASSLDQPLTHSAPGGTAPLSYFQGC